MNGEHSNTPAPLPTETASILPATLDALQRDAARYRWLREQAHPLESQHGAGKSCYHTVSGVRELKSGVELDEAVDAAIEQAAKNAQAIKQLMLFYCVGSLEDLILAQDRHIENLQAKLPDIAHFRPQRVREG
jgi:hypothetical protein